MTETELMSDAEFAAKLKWAECYGFDHWFEYTKVERAARIAAETRADKAEGIEREAYTALGPDCRFMDPPDGGSPTLAEQIGNMRRQLEAAEAKLAAVEAERDKAREDALRDGWNACRRSIYAVCEDVDREADEASKHDGEHAKGYAAGMARAAKSIARGFNAMEAEDDDNIRAMLAAAPEPPASVPPHTDDDAVDRFAAAMKAKLAQKRREGRGGWDDRAACSAEHLSNLLRRHIEKGDPLDVGNFAMMLHQRGEKISAAPVTKPFCWVLDSPGFYEPYSGNAEPPHVDFSPVEQPGYEPLYKGAAPVPPAQGWLEHHINLLTDGEGDAVTFCSPNQDFNGLPNECVVVSASWTGWTDREFRADTREECLRLAVAAMRAEARISAAIEPAPAEGGV